MSSNKLSNIHSFGCAEIISFTSTLICGIIYCSSAKILMEMQGSTTPTVDTGEPDENDGASSTTTTTTTAFQYPLTISFFMFIGMLLGLVLHWIVLLFHIPFPGYELNDANVNMGIRDKQRRRMEQATALINHSSTCGNDDGPTNNSSVPMGTFFILAALDVAATALCLMGLQHVELSIYQMLRGSAMVFVALFKLLVWKVHLYTFHWLGVVCNVVSVVIVGSTALLSGTEGGLSSSTTMQSLWGVFLILAGTWFLALQWVLIEQSMKMNVPGPLLVGMMGFWGALLSICVVFPIGYYVPGDDNGSYEDPFHAWSMIVNSVNIQSALIIYTFSSFLWNVLLSIMFCILSSVWGGIVENFRAIAVWVIDIIIFYCINSSFGESWTRYSYLQIVGMAVLIIGTAIYNAPNDCSILLEGQWWALGINLSHEYDEIRKEQEHETHVDLIEYENLPDE